MVNEALGLGVLQTGVLVFGREIRGQNDRLTYARRWIPFTLGVGRWIQARDRIQTLLQTETRREVRPID